MSLKWRRWWLLKLRGYMKRPKKLHQVFSWNCLIGSAFENFHCQFCGVLHAFLSSCLGSDDWMSFCIPPPENTNYSWMIDKASCVAKKKKRSKSLVFCTICIFAVDSILKLILKKIPVCVMWLHIFSNNHCVPLATIQTALFGSQTYQFSLIVLWIDFVLPKSILLMFVYRIVVCVMMIKTWFYYFYTFTEYFAFDLLAVTYVFNEG